MGSILLFAFIAVPILEIALFIEVGGYFGFWPTIGIVVLTAMVGTALLRQQGLATLAGVRSSLEENRFPLKEVFDGLCLLFAGGLLLTPGFFTDAVGLMMFVPPFRALLARKAARYMVEHGQINIHGSGFSHPETSEGPGAGPGKTVIDGEFRDITPEDEGPGPGGPEGGEKRPPRIPPAKKTDS